MVSDDEDFVTWEFNSPLNVNRVQKRKRHLLNGERFSQSPMRTGGRTIRQPNMFGLRTDQQAQERTQEQQTVANSSNPDRLIQFSRGLQQFTSLYTTNINNQIENNAEKMNEENENNKVLMDFACSLNSPLSPPLPEFDFPNDFEDELAAIETVPLSSSPAVSSNIINIDAIFGPEDTDLEEQLKAIDEHCLSRSTTRNNETRLQTNTVPVVSTTTNRIYTPEEIERKRTEAKAIFMANRWERNRTREDLYSNNNNNVNNVSNNNNNHDNNNNNCNLSGSSSSSSSSSSSNDDSHGRPTSIRGIPNVTLCNNFRAFPKR